MDHEWPRAWISGITFSDGTQVTVSPSDVLVIVGPNNCGKSEALRGIRDKLKTATQPNPVIHQISVARSGSSGDVLEWLQEWAATRVEPLQQPEFQAFGAGVHRVHVTSLWSRAEGLGDLCRFFCHLLTADERLQTANPPRNIVLSRDSPKHPIHFLLKDDRLELKLSAKFRRAFGVDLVVHRNAGDHVPLHVGERPIPEKGEDRVSLTYVERLERLPELHAQGDGMRSFAGVILAVSVGRESVLLIDEPEAFLHPPQARLLGATLVQDRAMGRQLFVATHSADLLRGLLDSESNDVRVLRLRRQGGANVVSVLDNSRIRELWGDPLLRYSNVLDGLFHECVIVCESDSDCRFYAAVHDSLYSGQDEEARHPDLMFTHCGGKDRLPVVVRALREVDVPVKVVADFDILSEEQPLRRVIEALGIEWSGVANDWRTVKGAIDSKKPELSTDEVAKSIRSILSSVGDPIFPSEAKDKIQGVLRRSSPWSHAKTVGKAFVPGGQPSQACERLLRVFRGSGLYIVEVGELEGFVRSEGGHGPKWVNAVLRRVHLASDPELAGARDFVRQVVGVSSLQPS
jgi:hypothetical protein